MSSQLAGVVQGMITTEHMADPGSASLKRFRFKSAGVKDEPLFLKQNLKFKKKSESLVWGFLGVISYLKCRLNEQKD